ncbi:hypothetical protein Tco_1482738 [Tanacetum coccineum]
MADTEKKSTMKGFATNDQADYYSGIRSIRVNGNNSYELNGKFLDDLHSNAFSGTNEKDAELGSDKIEPTNDETSDLEETDHDNEQEIGEIFRIETKKTCAFMNHRRFGFTNGTKMCHGYTKNHGRIMEHGKNPHQLHIVANLSIIKLDVQNGQQMESV